LDKEQPKPNKGQPKSIRFFLVEESVISRLVLLALLALLLVALIGLRLLRLLLGGLLVLFLFLLRLFLFLLRTLALPLAILLLLWLSVALAGALTLALLLALARPFLGPVRLFLKKMRENGWENERKQIETHLRLPPLRLLLAAGGAGVRMPHHLGVQLTEGKEKGEGRSERETKRREE
jgi:hypothetical protein